MPLFRRDSSKRSNSSPVRSPNLNPSSNNSSILPTESSNSITSSIDNNDEKSEFRRNHRSSSVSQKLKNLFIGDHNDHIEPTNNNTDNNNTTNNNIDDTAENSLKGSLSNKKSTLPIPNRTIGRNNVTSHSMQLKNREMFDQHNNNNINDEPNSFKPNTNTANINTNNNNNNNNNNIHIEQPKSSRIRSSTVSAHGNYMHDQLPVLHHTETVNYSSTHLKNERDLTIKLNTRLSLFDNGKLHEHDFSKYKTHPCKPTVGLFNWMKKKESIKGDLDSQSNYQLIEKSISLLPDKYSGNLMRIKNNPKNYIWNYDDDDDEEEEDDFDNTEYDTENDTNDDDDIEDKPRPNLTRKMSMASVYSSRSTKSRQSNRITKHYNSDDEYENENDYVKDMAGVDSSDDEKEENLRPDITKKRHVSTSSEEVTSEEEDDEDDEDDDDDDDDFDDEIDNIMIEPIIGKEQVFLINSMLNKIENPEKFKNKLKEKKQEGKIKLTLAQKYGHIEGVIGKGSYGTVCISSKTVNNTKIFFAIKQLKRKQGETLHHFGNRVTSEFMISSSLTHQAVINVYDLMFDPVSMTYSEIMEFIPCGDLFSLISVTHGLDIVECDCFFKQILNAITYLHSVGVSHNDLKIENLLLTRKGQLKIIDFGTSAVFKTAWENDIQLSLGACGSERYVAPEQYIKNREYDPRLGDVWSLGIIYLTMYYGKYSWESAKSNDEHYVKFVDSRANYDYSMKSTLRPHQFKLSKIGTYSVIENIKGGIEQSWRSKCGNNNISGDTNNIELINDSRKYVLYNILNPDPNFRMRTYQIWQSEWIKSFTVCDAGRGYVSYDNYIEMAMKSAQDVEEKEKERDRDNKDTSKDNEIINHKSNEDMKDKLERKESKKSYGFLNLGKINKN